MAELPDRKLKIAVYSGDIPSTTFIENLIEVLAESGFEIYLFGKKRKHVSYKGNVKVFATPESGLALFLFVKKESIKLFFKNRKLLLKTVRLLRKKNDNIKSFIRNLGFILPVLNNQPDVFHIQWAKTVNINSEIFDLLDCKIALSLRGAHINYSPINDEKLRQSYLKYFPVIDAFHAVSEAIGREAVKYGAAESKIRVIHSSVKDELLESKILLPKKREITEIISIGRHHWKKGYHYALDAMEILKKDNIKFRYSIIAQGEIPEELLFMNELYNLKDQIEFVPGMNHNDLMERLSQSDILLLPSVEEGIANVVLEAMSIGIPVITTDCGGMSEVVDDEINGYIIPVRNPEAIAEKIKHFVKTDSKVITKLIENAREIIKSDFTREKQRNEFDKFYHSMI